MSAAIRPPMCFSAQAPLWTRSALVAQTHRDERCHTTADVLFSAGALWTWSALATHTHTAMSAAKQPPMCFSAQAPLWTRSVVAGQAHRNERCHTTAEVLFSASTAVYSVDLGRRDTPT